MCQVATPLTGGSAGAISLPSDFSLHNIHNHQRHRSTRQIITRLWKSTMIRSTPIHAWQAIWPCFCSPYTHLGSYRTLYLKFRLICDAGKYMEDWPNMGRLGPSTMSLRPRKAPQGLRLVIRSNQGVSPRSNCIRLATLSRLYCSPNDVGSPVSTTTYSVDLQISF